VVNAINCHPSLKKDPVTLLLFDLDGTLLGNEMNNFIPAYLQALATRMSKVADPAIMVKTLLSATRQMVENQQPDKTLEEIFDAAFYPALGLLRQEVQGTIDEFYYDDFPKLKHLTQLRPEAVNVIERLIRRGDQAAIATNPLFPRTAILQRLSWAGIPSDNFPFVMIPSYETFHFAKPNPEFFAEMLAQLGWPKVPVLMVGNDIEMDIGAARQLGLPVFWVTSDGATAWNGEGELPPHGDLDDLLPWMERSVGEPAKANFSSPRALLAVLRSTPAAILTMCNQRKSLLGNRPAKDEWSPSEVLCHLRDVDTEVNLPRLRMVINEQNPFLAGQDTDPWAEIRQYHLQDGWQALKDFIASRLQIIHLLETLPADGWERTARHAIFGPTHLQELVNIIAGHDVLHIQQVHTALNRVTNN